MTQEPPQEHGERRQPALEKNGEDQDHIPARRIVLGFLFAFILIERILILRYGSHMHINPGSMPNLNVAASLASQRYQGSGFLSKCR